MDLSIKSSSQFLLDEEVDAEMEPINSPVDVIVLPNADIPKGVY
jgi:hypothetical protein